MAAKLEGWKKQEKGWPGYDLFVFLLSIYFWINYLLIDLFICLFCFVWD
jgi:hypothetical protein